MHLPKTPDCVLGYAVLSCNLQVPDPEFEGQTKTRLGNPEVRKIVEGIVSQVSLLCSVTHVTLSCCNKQHICMLDSGCCKRDNLQRRKFGSMRYCSALTSCWQI